MIIQARMRNPNCPSNNSSCTDARTYEAQSGCKTRAIHPKILAGNR